VLNHEDIILNFFYKFFLKSLKLNQYYHVFDNFIWLCSINRHVHFIVLYDLSIIFQAIMFSSDAILNIIYCLSLDLCVHIIVGRSAHTVCVVFKLNKPSQIIFACNIRDKQNSVRLFGYNNLSSWEFLVKYYINIF